MLHRTLRLVLVWLLLLPACDARDSSESDELTESEAAFTEEAAVEDRKAFQRSALEYVEQLQSRIARLEEANTVDPSTIRGLKAQTARVHESIRELDHVTAVTYRDLHSEIQNRLFRLEANITKVTLRSADHREELQELARKRLDTLGAEIDELVETMRRRGHTPRAPRAVDAGKLKKQYSRLAQRISTVDQDTTSVAHARSEIAEAMAQLLVDVRTTKDLIGYPEVGE